MMRVIRAAGTLRPRSEKARSAQAAKALSEMDGVLATQRAELGRVNKEIERKALASLLDRAEAPGASDEFRRYVTNYVRQQYEVLFGPDQYSLPLLGVLTAVVLPLALFGIFAVIWTEGSDPLGMRWPVFATVLVAGMAGGVVRVLWLSAHKQHDANSEMQLFFTGLLHPLIGGALGIALAAAFVSGLVMFPVDEPTAKVTVGEWTQAEVFLGFAGFLAGLFEERVIKLLGGLVPAQATQPVAGRAAASGATGPATAQAQT